MAQGVGNILAGLLGGIPITSVIVRSSVNIEAWCWKPNYQPMYTWHFIDGQCAFFLSSVDQPYSFSIPGRYPYLLVGYKLASVAIFREHVGQRLVSIFTLFAITTVAILLTDVLLGVLIGTAASVFFPAKRELL